MVNNMQCSSVEDYSFVDAVLYICHYCTVQVLLEHSLQASPLPQTNAYTTTYNVRKLCYPGIPKTPRPNDLLRSPMSYKSVILSAAYSPGFSLFKLTTVLSLHPKFPTKCFPTGWEGCLLSVTLSSIAAK